MRRIAVTLSLAAFALGACQSERAQMSRPLPQAAAYQGVEGRWAFAAGAALGSVVWFVGLGYGARLASGLFARPGAWRVLDLLIGIVMLALAVSLALG